MKSENPVYILKSLASILEKNQLKTLDDIESSVQKCQKMTNEQIIVNLDTLIKLGTLDKSQWIEFASKNNINIDIRPRDASRDALGKILKFLEKNPEIKNSIAKRLNPHLKLIRQNLQTHSKYF